VLADGLHVVGEDGLVEQSGLIVEASAKVIVDQQT